MLHKSSLKLLLLVIVMAGSRLCSFAQADPIEHMWYNQEKVVKILIYKGNDQKFYGKIAWMREPMRDGKPKTDSHNPDESRRNDAELGLVILKGFKKDGTNEYSDGTIYDPRNGKTYSCKMTLEGNELNVRGYVGFSMLGRSTKWTKAD
jgi:uncharacterized protein (DUF2147 family)